MATAPVWALLCHDGAMSGLVEVFHTRTLRLVEGALPSLLPEERTEMDRRWDEAVQRQPAFFDGPTVASLGVEHEGDALVLHWARCSYRYRALRQVPGATWLPAPVFVTVLQPTPEGSLIVGRSADWTAVPGRWSFPGGSAEPPRVGAPFGEQGLREHAARELGEETGIEVLPDDLGLFAVSRGKHASIGVHFLAPQLPEGLVREHHARLREAEAARGREGELDVLSTVGSETEALALGCVADYLPPLVARYTSPAAR